ncbi:energy transducer TonB [Pedobacter sp. HDW13]|uniref:energy transducer TonB n=1 Tax=Pedobacter sp. HDW13 TaxID=2714940 RepID=UPI00140B0B7B|nr:energy transducer TonB [Pedobacter sp. HDW13]QIL39791.1 energy transducer TonB [Pedobacter sp. HDW13]
MRKLMIIALLGCAMFINSANAQNKDQKVYDFVSVQKQPAYPGGIAKFYEYIKKEIKYPEVAKKNKTQGKVFLSFVVEKDGKLTDIVVIRGLSPETNAEAIRLFKQSPKWNPAMQDGKLVRVKYNMAINFDLAKAGNTKTASLQQSDTKTPQYQGGLTNLYRYLAKNIKYPKVAQKNNVQGKVMLSFNVEEDGSLSNITVIKSLSKETDEEAIRVMKSSPRWNPGLDKGIPVRSKYVMNINFTLS